MLEIPAGHDFYPVSTRLMGIHEEAIADAVTGWASLQRDAGIAQDFGGACHLVPRILPEGDMVQTAAHALDAIGGIGDVVRLARGGEPTRHLALGPVLRDNFVLLKAERLDQEPRAWCGVARQEAEMIQPPRRGPAPDVSLR